MSTWVVRAVGGLAVAAALGGCTGESAGLQDAIFPETPLTTLTSDDGMLSLEVRTAPMQPPSRGSIEIELAITDANGEPREGLDLHVVPWMTDMSHGTSTEPEIEETGGGRYELGPVDMFMSGRWELRTTIAGPVEDSAKIVFEIP